MAGEPKLTLIKDLFCDAVTMEPMDFDWGEGYGETWDIVYPDVENWTRAQCIDYWQNIRGFLPKDVGKEWDLETLREHARELMENDADAFSPVMNYAYPLPDLQMSAEHAQSLLLSFPLVVVLMENGQRTVLALSGGGMDFSWDICEAYMVLGYLPPVHFCPPPRIAGKGLSPRTRWVLRGCRASLNVLRQRVEWKHRDIKSTEDWLREREAREKQRSTTPD